MTRSRRLRCVTCCSSVDAWIRIGWRIIYMGLMTPKGPFSGAHRGIGRSFRHVLSSARAGSAASLAGQPTAGIGAAMRIAPVALYFGDETGPMFDSVMAASLMTHRDIRSLSGALAVAHGVRRLASGEPLEASLLFRIAADLRRMRCKSTRDSAARYSNSTATPVVFLAHSLMSRRCSRSAVRAGLGGSCDRSQPSRCRSGLPARDHGLPTGLHPDLLLSLDDDRFLRRSPHRGRQSGGRYRHGRCNSRGSGTGTTTVSMPSPNAGSMAFRIVKGSMRGRSLWPIDRGEGSISRT